MLRWTSVLTAVLVMLSLGSACVAAEFSADMYLGSESLQKRGRICTNGKRLRFEQRMGAAPYITIVCLDKNVAWVLDAKTRTYVEMPLPKGAQSNPRSDDMFSKNAVKKRLGVETVSGVSCEKTSYVSKTNSKQTAVRYYSKKLDWPIKTHMTTPQGQSITQELRNIRLAKQPASLFELPKGYKKVIPPKAPAKKSPDKK